MHCIKIISKTRREETEREREREKGFFKENPSEI